MPTLPRDSDTEPSSDDETPPEGTPEEEEAIEEDEDETRELELAVEGQEFDGEIDVFTLPSIEEREEELKGAGPSVQDLQRRIQGISAVLSNFKRLAQKDRWVLRLSSLSDLMSL